MKSPNPERLLNDPEFGSLLEGAKAADGLSAERIATNGARIAQRVSALEGASGAAAVGGSAALKVGVAGVLIAAVGGAIWFFNPSETPTVQPDPAPVVVQHDNPQPAQVVVPVADEQQEPVTTDESTDQQSTPVEVAVAVPAQPTPAHVEAVPVEQTQTAEPASSTLTEELAAFETARAAANRADYDGAIQQLDELLTTWPDTALPAEVELSRADYLVRAGRLSEATDAVGALLKDPAHAGRKAELYQLLGDLWVKQNNCPAAVAAYSEVVALDGPVDQGVRRGLERCSGE